MYINTLNFEVFFVPVQFSGKRHQNSSLLHSICKSQKLSINSFYCFTQYVNSISTKPWLKKIRNSSLEFRVYFIWCPCSGSVMLKNTVVHNLILGGGVKLWIDGNIIWRLCRFHERPSCTSGKWKFWSIRNVFLDVIWYRFKNLDIIQCKRNVTAISTHPFSSLSCWYNSNLLFTELTLPTNSWCFLELAAVMRLVHMVRSETGPAARVKQNHREKKNTHPVRPAWCHQLLFAVISSDWSNLIYR